jgi:hypothetical protein
MMSRIGLGYRPNRRLKKSRFQPILHNNMKQDQLNPDENPPLNLSRPYDQLSKREKWHFHNEVGRTSFQSLHKSVIDIQRKDAAQLYRQNWDGCRALWIQDYRLKKALRLSRKEKQS